MSIEKLKEDLKTFKNPLNQYETPEVLQKNLLSAYRDPLPGDVASLFQDYQKAYQRLLEIYQNIDAIIEQASTEKQHEINFTIPLDAIRTSVAELEKSYVSIQLDLSSKHRSEQPNNPIISKTDDEEITVLNNEDFSENFLTNLQNDIQRILDIANCKTPVIDKINSQLKNETLDQINASFINEGFCKDYPRGLCPLEGQSSNPSMTGQEIINAVENFIAPYLSALKKEHSQLSAEQLENTKNNLKVMLSTLSFQSGLPFLGESLLTSIFSFNYKPSDEDSSQNDSFLQLAPNEPYILNNYLIDKSIISFPESIDEKTGNKTTKIRIETILQRNGFKTWNGILFDGKTSEKIVLDIDAVTNESGDLVFKIAKCDVAVAAKLPNKTLQLFQLAIKNDALKNPHTIGNSKQLDILRPNLTNIAQFAGYKSLEDFVRTTISFAPHDSEEKKQINIKQTAKERRFEPIFIEQLKLKNSSETKFLTQLSTDFYREHIDNNQLAENILSFFEQQIPQLSYADKLRYFHLLKVAESFGATREKIADVVDKALNQANAFNYQNGLTEGECIGIRELYKSFYTGKIKQEVLENRMKIFLQPQFNKELEKNGKNVNTSRHACLLNIAADYSYYDVMKPFSSQKTVDILSQRPDSKEIIFAAAKANRDIYREIVNPAITLSYLFNRFKASLPKQLGGSNSRPKFTPQQHLQLIEKHSDFLNHRNSDNPYRKLLNQNSPKDKLDFLIRYTNNNLQRTIAKVKNLGTDFFDAKLQEYLTSRAFINLDNLIKTGNPVLLTILSGDETLLHPLFADYARAGSVEDRLGKVIEIYALDPAHIRERFGKVFILTLNQQLNTLIKEETARPTESFESIREIFEQNPWLYKTLGVLKVKTFISKPIDVIAARGEVEKNDETLQQAKNQEPEEITKESLKNTHFGPLFEHSDNTKTVPQSTPTNTETVVQPIPVDTNQFTP